MFVNVHFYGSHLRGRECSVCVAIRWVYCVISFLWCWYHPSRMFQTLLTSGRGIASSLFYADISLLECSMCISSPSLVIASYFFVKVWHQLSVAYKRQCCGGLWNQYLQDHHGEQTCVKVLQDYPTCIHRILLNLLKEDYRRQYSLYSWKYSWELKVES